MKWAPLVSPSSFHRGRNRGKSRWEVAEGAGRPSAAHPACFRRAGCLDFTERPRRAEPGHGPRCRQPCPARPAPGAPHVFAERAKHRLVGRLVCGAILTPGPRLQFPRSARRWQAANRRKPSLENLAGPQGVCEKQYPGSIPFQIDVLGRGVLAGEVRSGAVIGETRLAEEAGAGLWAPGWA